MNNFPLHSTQLTSMKVSMLSIRAWALQMMNWFTQAMAWDLQRIKHVSSGVKQSWTLK